MESTKVMLRDRVTAGLGGNLLSLDGAQAHILSLNLSERGLGDEQVREMAKSLVAEVRRRHSQIRTLRASTNVTLQLSIRLDSNEIGDDGAVALASALTRASDIAQFRVVNLFMNRIGDRGATALASFVRDASHGVEQLRLGANRFGPNGRVQLAEATQQRGTWLQLPSSKAPSRREQQQQRRTNGRPSLSRNDGLRNRRIFKPSSGDESVLIARLGGLDLSDSDVVQLAARIPQDVRAQRKTMRLPTTSSLVELVVLLQQNRVGDDGVAALVTAFREIRDVAWVSDLRLYDNCVGDDGARALGHLFVSMVKPPRELHLSHNDVGTQGAKALLDAVAGVYPIEGAPPLWLQLNNNSRVDGARVAAYADQDLSLAVCCMVDHPGEKRKSPCSKDACKGEQISCRSTAVHLVYSSVATTRTVEAAESNHAPRGMDRRPTTSESDNTTNNKKSTATSKPLNNVSLKATSIGGLLRVARDGKRIVLDMANQSPRLTDREVVRIAVRMTTDVPRIVETLEVPVDFDLLLSGNEIGDRGVVALCGALLHMSHMIRVAKFDLAGNSVADNGVKALADLVSKAKHPVVEIRLDRNRIESCSKLVGAAKGRYPVTSPSGGRDPLKLDVRHNAISRDTLAHTVACAEEFSIRLGLISSGDDDESCDSDCAVRLLSDVVVAIPRKTMKRKNSEMKHPSAPLSHTSPFRHSEANEGPREGNKIPTPLALSDRPSPVRGDGVAAASKTTRPDEIETAANATQASKQKKKEMTKKKLKDEGGGNKVQEPGESYPVGRLVAKSLRDLGYEARHAQWIEASFARCKDQVATKRVEDWIIFDRDESFEYTLSGRESLAPQRQSRLQDDLLRRGCVAIVTVAKRDNRRGTLVSVVACTDDLKEMSFQEIGAIVRGCHQDRPTEASKKKKKKVSTQQAQRRSASSSAGNEQRPPAAMVETESSMTTTTTTKKSDGPKAAGRRSKSLDKEPPVSSPPPEETTPAGLLGEDEEEPSSPLSPEHTRSFHARSSPPCGRDNSLASDRKGWGDDDDEEDDEQQCDGSVSGEAPAEESANDDKVGYAEAAAAAMAAMSAQSELDKAESAAAAASSGLEIEVAHELRSTLSGIEDAVWDYIQQSIDGQGMEASEAARTDVVSSVLDALVPAFGRLNEDGREACASALLWWASERGRPRVTEDSPASSTRVSLEGVLGELTTLVRSNDGETTHPELTSPPAAESGASPTDRWASMVTRMLKASADKSSRVGTAFAAIFVWCEARRETEAATAVQVLRLAAGPGDEALQDGELLQVWKDCNKDVEAACAWLAERVGSAANPGAASPASAKGEGGVRDALRRRAQADKRDKKKRDEAAMKRREERLLRDVVIERYAQRPSTAGWRSSIEARTVVYGSEKSNIRYLDGKVVSTTGQKEVVIRGDAPPSGEGNNRLRKTGGGSMRCAAAGSRTSK